MRNKIDFDQEPQDLFLNPWQDPGMSLLSSPDYVWQTVEKARICGFAASDDPGTQTRLTRLIRSIENDHNFSKAIIYNTVPALLEDATFVKSFVRSGEKYLLTGAAGIRLINRYQWLKKEIGEDADGLLGDYFDGCRIGNEGRHIPVKNVKLGHDIDFAIPCRNAFNYFHFMTEALCQLTLLDHLDFRGNVYFHFPNPEDRQRAFTTAFINALFPELAGRVFFERAPKSYDRVLTAYDMVGGHAQAPADVTDGIDRFAPSDILQRGGSTSVAARRSFSANAINQTLYALRDRALRAIEGQDFSYLPRRFYVGRADHGSRARHMAGEDMLVEHLRLFDFEYVAFEDLLPLEQIALMARAEVMISSHGAGFTNMLFTNPDALVVEIGTIETAQHRWGDFWPMANVAGCTYVNFFTDIKEEDPDVLAERDTGGLSSISLSRGVIGDILAFVVSVLGYHPELKTPATVERLVRQLLKIGAPEKALQVLERHDHLVKGHADLCLLKADCHKELDEPKSELLSLDASYKNDPSRWHTLVRIIWCARKCERPQVIRWALSRLQSDFPERHEIFVSNHEWVRYVA